MFFDLIAPILHIIAIISRFFTLSQFEKKKILKIKKAKRPQLKGFKEIIKISLYQRKKDVIIVLLTKMFGILPREKTMFDSKILIVDDEKDISDLIEIALKTNDFSNVKKAGNGVDALNIIESYKPDLILLDLMLPGIDGLTICKNLKKSSSTCSIPIIMITAKSGENDIITGLELGANDYITKPFSTKILIARIKNQLRNPDSFNKTKNEEIKYKNLVINLSKRTAFLDGQEIGLTYSEFEILVLLIGNQNRVFTRNQLLLHLKGDSGYDIGQRAVDVQILNLRRKLGPLGRDINTVRGIGYRLNEKTC